MVWQRFLTLGLVAAAAVALVLGNGFSAAPEKTSHVTQVYSKNCLACHGADGKGTEMRKAMPTIPDFTNRKWQDGVSNIQIKISILEGKGALMPPFRDKVNDDENKELTGFVREFAPK
jgi:mono/diheme cytochrome c family protein